MRERATRIKHLRLGTLARPGALRTWRERTLRSSRLLAAIGTVLPGAARLVGVEVEEEGGDQGLVRLK